MVQKEFVIKNPSGLHARPASVLTSICKKFPCSVVLVCGEKRVNPKSIISVLGAGIGQGSKVLLETAGEQEQEAMEQIGCFIEDLIDE